MKPAVVLRGFNPGYKQSGRLERADRLYMNNVNYYSSVVSAGLSAGFSE